jgi:hypothetical protein
MWHRIRIATIIPKTIQDIFHMVRLKQCYAPIVISQELDVQDHINYS